MDAALGMLRVGTVCPCPMNQLSWMVKCGKVGWLMSKCEVVRSASYRR